MASKVQLLKRIRQFCDDCMGGNHSAALDCPSGNCPLNPLRGGIDRLKGPPDPRRQELARRMTAKRTKTPL